MLSVKEFYAPEKLGGIPWAMWSALYSICAVDPFRLWLGGYHCGVDIPARGDVPALLTGRVVRVRLSGQLGSVVVLECLWQGRMVYVSYCHLAKTNLPKEGTRIGQGERVGTLATGDPDGSITHWNFPGSAWNGPHLHQVIGFDPDSAYMMISGHRTLKSFIDPRIVHRAVLAAPAGGESNPGTEPTIPKEWDEMATEAEVEKAVEKVVAQAVANSPHSALKIVGVSPGDMYLTGPGGAVHISSPDDLKILRRHIRATATGEETFTKGQVKLISRYLAALKPLA